MDEIGSKYNIEIANKVSLFIIFMLLFSIIIVVPGHAIPNDDKVKKDIHKDKIKEDINQKKCQKCHGGNSPSIDKASNDNIKGGQTKDGTIRSVSSSTVKSMSTSGNYTTVLEIGQAPQQLGFAFGGGYTGWQWWDTDGFGSEEQKNIVMLSILDNSTGTIKPVSGLVSLPTWPQASYRKYGGAYSYKADTDPSPISTQNNYPDVTEIWMAKAINLTGVSSATLTFWTWYSMETDWDYGYVAVSTDGDSWTNLPGTLTTNANPNGNNLGNGITGNSGGNWLQETMDLTPYTGKKILLGFRFKSDAATNEEGWYVDDITVSGGIFSDNAETLPEIKTLSINMTYPKLTISGATDPLTPSAGLQYSQGVRQIKLQEYLNHPGTYYGYFISGSFAEQYSGNYVVTLDTTINNTPVTATTQSQTTIYGCQNCHNKKQTYTANNVETSYIHGEGGGMESCGYICHSGSRGWYKWGGPSSPPFFGPPLNANPMNVHEMKYGHRGGFLRGYNYPQPTYDVQAHINLSCIQCHTSFVHNNVGTDTQKVASYTLYGTNISFSSGTHQNLTCENCHGTLDYPEIPNNQFQIQDVLGDYKPTYTSYESFTDTYAINVNDVGNLNIGIEGDSSKIVSLYVIGPVDNTTKGLQGPCYGNPCEKSQSLSTPINMNIANPYIGTWLVKITQLEEGRINYTITSSYPIQRKPIIKIPECKDCHNSNGQGGAYTTLDIPNWNPGFAHADTNDDGILDIQCRTCHNAMHNTETKNCRDCHTTAPTGHAIKEPQFSQYTVSQCLSCHGDPHVVQSGGDKCIECHGTNYTGQSSSSSMLVDIGLFNTSVHQNINKTVPDGMVTNDDCWICHYNKNMDRNSVRKCGYCHNKVSQWHGNANVTTNITELAIR